MLREVTRETVDLMREHKYLAHAPALRVEAGSGHSVLRNCTAPAAPDRGRQGSNGVLAQAKGFADLADRRAAAIRNNRGGDAGAIATILAVDILNDLFAP